eukprot:4759291-Prymnesium_polylepis.1
MSVLIKLPFSLSFAVTKLSLKMAFGRLGFMTLGAVLGWWGHKRYGTRITEGISEDIVRIWRTMDADGDGKVTLTEFKAAVKGHLGKFSPSDDVLTVIYVRITEACRVVDANGDGKFTNEELLAVVKAKLSWLA